MKKKEFNNLISSFSKNIKLMDNFKIQSIKEKFPYAEIIHNITLLKAHLEKDINFSDILTTTALYSSSRKTLFELINPNIKIDQSIKNEKILRFEDWLNNKQINRGGSRNEAIVKRSIQDNDHLTTETLAEIYVNQGHYKRAIQAYNILCLKYPKKSGFFANRIKEIKNKTL